VSAYWALGGRVGIGTLAIAIQEQVDDRAFIAVVWVTAALKVAAGLVALALVRPWGRRLPRRVLAVGVWGAAGVLLLYGGAGWVQAMLWEVGVHDVPATMGDRAAWWKLVFWDPFWLLGGVLFLAAARRCRARAFPRE